MKAFIIAIAILFTAHGAGNFTDPPLRPDWPSALRLFANVDEDEATVASRTRDALREVASVSTARTSGAYGCGA